MTWITFLAGFVTGVATTFVVLGAIRLISDVRWRRRERKRGYEIDVYEPEPLTPVKKH